MPSIEELQLLLLEPREDLATEYKDWLNLHDNHGKATLAKAAIAFANHGGGFLVLGFSEQGDQLVSVARPVEMPEPTQDDINAAIRRFASPEFHADMYPVLHPGTGVVHPVIAIPGNHKVPVMSKKLCEGVIAQNRYYCRKPGPRSEEILTAEDWRAVIDRCIRAGRDDMLESIRAILSGRVEAPPPIPDAAAELEQYCAAAHERWQELVAGLPANSPARFPHGFYELGFIWPVAQALRHLDNCVIAFVESFNGRMRDELLNETMFRNLAHARIVIARLGCRLQYRTPALGLGLPDTG